MSTSTWRDIRAALRDLGHALLHGEAVDDGRHPPDTHRRLLLHTRHLR
ncbi:hypothetical protein [Leifsonia sp. AG29]|nr:hypothetical protein [Leifsonia sp. AG29]